MSSLYLRMEDDENALLRAQQAQDLYVEAYGPDNPNSAIALTNIGKCRMHMGDYAGATQALEEALRLNIRFNGTSNRQTFRSKEALGDLAAAQGKPDEALRIYSELEAEMEQSFGDRNPDLLALREKLRAFEGA